MGAATDLAHIREIVGRYTERLVEEMPVEAVYLFGSYVQGTAREYSDIDVAVISPALSGIRFHDNVRLAKLTDDIDVRIEPKGFRPEEFNDDHIMASEILRTGIRIYPASKEAVSA